MKWFLKLVTVLREAMKDILGVRISCSRENMHMLVIFLYTIMELVDLLSTQGEPWLRTQSFPFTIQDAVAS